VRLLGGITCCVTTASARPTTGVPPSIATSPHLRNACEDDFDLLQIAAVAYLKKLDELHDDRGARTAVDKMLAARLETRGA
jgi:hypothetical protein